MYEDKLLGGLEYTEYLTKDLLCFFFTLTLYTVYDGVGRGNLVLRRSVSHFHLIIRDIVY